MFTGALNHHGSALAKLRYTQREASARCGRVDPLSCCSPNSGQTESHVPSIYTLYPEMAPAWLVLLYDTLWCSILASHTFYFFTHIRDFASQRSSIWFGVRPAYPTYMARPKLQNCKSEIPSHSARSSVRSIQRIVLSNPSLSYVVGL